MQSGHVLTQGGSNKSDYVFKYSQEQIHSSLNAEEFLVSSKISVKLQESIHDFFRTFA